VAGGGVWDEGDEEEEGTVQQPTPSRRRWLTAVFGVGHGAWQMLRVEVGIAVAAALVGLIGTIVAAACPVSCPVYGTPAGGWLQLVAFMAAVAIPARLLDKLVFGIVGAAGDAITAPLLNPLFFYAGALEGAIARFMWVGLLKAGWHSYLPGTTVATVMEDAVLALLVFQLLAMLRNLAMRILLRYVLIGSFEAAINDVLFQNLMLLGISAPFQTVLAESSTPMPDAPAASPVPTTDAGDGSGRASVVGVVRRPGPAYRELLRMYTLTDWRRKLDYVSKMRFRMYNPAGELVPLTRRDVVPAYAKAVFRRIARLPTAVLAEYTMRATEAISDSTLVMAAAGAEWSSSNLTLGGAVRYPHLPHFPPGAVPASPSEAHFPDAPTPQPTVTAAAATAAAVGVRAPVSGADATPPLSALPTAPPPVAPLSPPAPGSRALTAMTFVRPSAAPAVATVGSATAAPVAQTSPPPLAGGAAASTAAPPPAPAPAAVPAPATGDVVGISPPVPLALTAAAPPTAAAGGSAFVVPVPVVAPGTGSSGGSAGGGGGTGGGAPSAGASAIGRQMSTTSRGRANSAPRKRAPSDFFSADDTARPADFVPLPAPDGKAAAASTVVGSGGTAAAAASAPAPAPAPAPAQALPPPITAPAPAPAPPQRSIISLVPAAAAAPRTWHGRPSPLPLTGTTKPPSRPPLSQTAAAAAPLAGDMAALARKRRPSDPGMGIPAPVPPTGAAAEPPTGRATPTAHSGAVVANIARNMSSLSATMGRKLVDALQSALAAGEDGIGGGGGGAQGGGDGGGGGGGDGTGDVGGAGGRGGGGGRDRRQVRAYPKLTLQHLATVLNPDEVDIERAMDALDANGDYLIELDEFMEAVMGMWTNLRTLKASLDGQQSVSTAINLLLDVVFWLFFMAAALWIYDVPVVQVFLPLGTILVSASFAIGNSLSNVVSSLIFVLLARPFHVGDRVTVSGYAGGEEPVIVKRIDVLTTTFLRMVNKELIVPNHMLLGQNIENFKRSPPACIRVELHVSYATTAGQLEALRLRINAYLTTLPLLWKPTAAIRMTAVREQRLVLTVWVQSFVTWQELTRLSKASFDMHMHLVSCMRDLGIVFRAPDQNIRIEGSLGGGGGYSGGYGGGGGGGALRPSPLGHV